jgi:hypothetical protein
MLSFVAVFTELINRVIATTRRSQNVPSVARVAAGALGFLTFSHAFDCSDLIRRVELL